ncbi:5-(carboxyamino)imidazole ribonucleotide synthase [Patescibacteria group bacterium]|nr:5-(carboxyamino)imidazole ribonucleotide synthase [Patescibacteria group bacterium]
MDRNAVFLPGSVIGILGGGQLGKMTALAAYQLGYKVIVWCQSAEEPAAQIATYKVIAPFDDLEARQKFLMYADVVTYEFENVSHSLAVAIEKTRVLRSSASILAITQNRWEEKSFLKRIGIPTVRTMPIRTYAEMQACKIFAVPSILKTAQNGYDGKGQVLIRTHQELETKWHLFKGVPCTLEEKAAVEYEISVIVARDTRGLIEMYSPIENVHVEGILDRSYYPGDHASPAIEATARAIAQTIAERLHLNGLLAVEMFVLKNGRVLVNEIAPRPHNSGHLTIEACRTSQFEQHVRAVCNLPLGSTHMRPGTWAMQNLINVDEKECGRYFGNECASVHWYGKKEPRIGRKMGHVTFGPK